MPLCILRPAAGRGIPTRRLANPGHRFINLRVKYRKSYTVLVLLSLRASKAAFATRADSKISMLVLSNTPNAACYYDFITLAFGIRKSSIQTVIITEYSVSRHIVPLRNGYDSVIP